jgi:segregation and condensation protein B
MQQHIEALIFASDSPLTIEEIQVCIKKLLGTELSSEQIQTDIDALVAKYEDEQFSFHIIPIAGGYQFFTKNSYEPTIAEFVKHKLNKKLSTGQLECLSIIAYKHPVSKSDIEQIRGVNCDYAIQKLLEKDLIIISGRSESAGKAILYSVSPYFLNYFGINSTADLPKLKEIEVIEENSIGIPNEVL